jgi:mono/diheme cytochrome c family protein
MKYFFLIFGAVVIAVVAFAGFRGDKTGKPPFELFPDMDAQPKYKPQRESEFNIDGRASRTRVEGTVPFEAKADRYYFMTGKDGAGFGNGFPVEVNMALLKRGQERFTISCAVCHGPTGAGNGITTELGLVWVANFHDPRIVAMNDGEIFNTITHGKGVMLGYPQIKTEDRWAIIAYLRALQRSQRGSLSDVPDAEKEKLLSEGVKK